MSVLPQDADPIELASQTKVFSVVKARNQTSCLMLGKTQDQEKFCSDISRLKFCDSKNGNSGCKKKLVKDFSGRSKTLIWSQCWETFCKFPAPAGEVIQAERITTVRT